MQHPALKTADYRKEAVFALSVVGIDLELWLERLAPPPPPAPKPPPPPPAAFAKPCWSRRLGA
ncbi:MAG: hypothetical protein HYY18_05945 [Planctomycetes bacterium]|nr:hypothetical protein [Planctomycetota bacterium]